MSDDSIPLRREEVDANSEPILNWARDDVEQRLGFPGAPHTRVRGLLSFLMACAGTLAVYGLVWLASGTYLFEMFTGRGWVPYLIVFFSSWSLAVLIIKWRKLAFQRKALAIGILPEDRQFVLSPATVDEVLHRIYDSVDDPRNFVVFNRVVVALSNLRNLGRVSDVDEILRSQGDQDESSMETSYALVQGFVWAIPVLGFIGTVLGLSAAIGGFTGVLRDVSEVDEIVSALQGVTVGLSTAFETTLEALVAALVIQLLLTVLKKSEEEFLDQCSEYCGRNVVSRLRLLPFNSDSE